LLEIISQVNELFGRIRRLESLETPFKSYGLWANRPTAPFDGQRYFATDATRRLEYEWDSTASNWFSTQQFTSSIPVLTTAVTPVAFFPLPRSNDIYVDRLDLNFAQVNAGKGRPGGN
jgi:hypothetical protein